MVVILILKVFLSTLSLRRATRVEFQLNFVNEISIHALLTESDIGLTYDGLIASAFLSTLSLRRATLPVPKRGLCTVFLSTLSLRRATAPEHRGYPLCEISIHALLTESDI